MTSIILTYDPVLPSDVRQSVWGILVWPAFLVMAAFGSALV